MNGGSKIMDFIDWIGIGIWIWGAYKGWGTVSSWKWEWINRPELLNYVVKGAFCILIGLGVAAFQLAKLGLALACTLFKFL